jgi:hypothetical protein
MPILFGFRLPRILQMSLVSLSNCVAVVLHGRFFYIAGNGFAYGLWRNYNPLAYRLNLLVSKNTKMFWLSNSIAINYMHCYVFGFHQILSEPAAIDSFAFDYHF